MRNSSGLFLNLKCKRTAIICTTSKQLNNITHMHLTGNNENIGNSRRYQLADGI